MDEQRLELKVGVFALVGLALAVGLFVALSGITSGHRFVFQADFGYAGGLPAGAAVKIAGVKVGKIRAVTFRPEARDPEDRAIPVRLTAEIDPMAATALRADATATVGTQGALGESYLEVLPGSKPEHLAENAAIRGLDPPRLDLVLARLFAVLESASTDEALRTFLIDVAGLAHSIDGILRSNRDDITRFLTDAATLLGSARETMGNVQAVSKGAALFLASPEAKDLVSDFSVTAKAARTEIPGLLTDTHALVANLQKASGALSPEDVAHVKDMVTRFDALGGQLQEVSAKADDLLGKVQRGEGTLGKALKDPQVWDDLRALLTEIKAKPWRLVWKE
jgi:phospholipid/cholesterol/gamma-HCH transport system substrate-binding protein